MVRLIVVPLFWNDIRILNIPPTPIILFYLLCGEGIKVIKYIVNLSLIKKKCRQNCQPFRYQKDSKDWQPLKDKRRMFYWQTNTYLGEALPRFQNRANCPLGNVFFCFQVYLNYIAKHVQTVFNIWQIILQGQQWITKPNPLMNSIRKPVQIKQIFLRLQTKRNKAKHNLFSS